MFIHPHLEATASMALLGQDLHKSADLRIQLLLARIPRNPDGWSESDERAVEAAIKHLNEPNLSTGLQAELHYLWGQLIYRMAYGYGPDFEAQTALHLEKARDLFLESGDDLSAHNVAKNLFRLRKRMIAHDVEVPEFATMYGDCLALRNASLPPCDKILLSLLERLYARALGIVRDDIGAIIRAEIVQLKHAGTEAQGLSVFRIQDILLLALQTGHLNVTEVEEMYSWISYRFSAHFLHHAILIYKGEPAPFGRQELSERRGLVAMQKQGVGIVPTRWYVFRRLLQTDLGITSLEANKLFEVWNIPQPVAEHLLGPDPKPNEDAFQQFIEAYKSILSTPPQGGIPLDEAQRAAADLHAFLDPNYDQELELFTARYPVPALHSPSTQPQH